LVKYPSVEWLFLSDTGRPLTYQAWQKMWHLTRKAAGYPEMDTHDFRHFFASALIAGGASVKQVQTALAHESPVVTLRCTPTSGQEMTTGRAPSSKPR
jgi:integrase